MRAYGSGVEVGVFVGAGEPWVELGSGGGSVSNGLEVCVADAVSDEVTLWEGDVLGMSWEGEGASGRARLLPSREANGERPARQEPRPPNDLTARRPNGHHTL